MNPSLVRTVAVPTFGGLALLLTVASANAETPPVCGPGTAPLTLTGLVTPQQKQTYRLLPFAVLEGTGRVEVGYRWTDRPGLPSTPLTATTLDLGLWDEDGTRGVRAFRGWGGSRQGRLDLGQPPVFVQADAADRGFTPGRVKPGLWHVEIGIAAVAPQGADYEVQIACKAALGSKPAADRVDPHHVARFEPGWYHGDFHMHAYHSNPRGPDDVAFVAQARAAQLDFLMVTEYVTGRHWDTLGMAQRLNPDLVIWPGREIITYFGHMNTHGETPSVLEYRHGFEDIRAGEIQRRAKADGALFQVNHPTLFPGPLFANFCRGCEFRLDRAIDWHLVDTMEILTGPVLATADDLGVALPLGTLSIEQPFMATAIALWERRLREGYKITAVSGSDSKGVEGTPEERARKGYGSSATAVYADELSRPALTRAIQAGHAYVRTRGVAASPALVFEATTADGQRGIFGDTLEVEAGENVELRTTVTGGAGQVLTVLRNGAIVLSVPITTDPFVHTFKRARRVPWSEGPLGTFWRVETRDPKSRTAIGNPVFLRAPAGSD
ncbi:MAG TPA: CehA/McbA family metallohydrolase [Nevskiaceae bacterium]|nr:CehA/McbA family metallohydrolase [Nevskiaceae bacterium]